MVRFCDADVGRVQYDLLDRDELFSYFLAGHLDGIICVYDNFEAGNFMGIVTYYSLLHAISLDAAILKEYVILDQAIWRNARELFKNGRVMPIPVLDQDNRLIYFAYQDMDANREIRMLRELVEIRGTFQFSNLFPECKCVKIHGFNELAYYFAEYLRNQNIMVQVEDAMWEGFFGSEACIVPEYECLNIYAEGTWEKTCNWKSNLLRSVSVEFECIDKIYEKNLKYNLIKNIGGGGV